MTTSWTWPTLGTFHANWPLLSEDLVVAQWKIAEAESLFETASIDVEMLDPPQPPERDWREVYAAELASHPLILQDLERGGRVDGVELVLERAGLTIRERVVIRGFLMGEDEKAITRDLAWRPQTVTLMLHNALARLRDPCWGAPRPATPAAAPLNGSPAPPSAAPQVDRGHRMPGMAPAGPIAS